MIEFIQKQIEASERLFEMMRSDHDTRMKEMEHWARTTQSLDREARRAGYDHRNP
jgi:hypothetical protein